MLGLGRNHDREKLKRELLFELRDDIAKLYGEIETLRQEWIATVAELREVAPSHEVGRLRRALAIRLGGDW